MTKLPMRWECGALSLAWCCYARGTNCGRRWKATRRLRQEGLYERDQGTEFEASGRDDLPVVPRTATGPHARAGTFRAHARMRDLPHAAARAGARIALVDAGDARGKRAAAVASGAVSGKGAALDAMDLGPGIWTCGNGSVRALHHLHSALAAATRTGGVRRIEPAEPIDFPELLLERMAIHDHTSGDIGAGDRGRVGRDVPAAAHPPRIGASSGVRGIVRGAGGAGPGIRHGVSPRGSANDRQR